LRLLLRCFLSNWLVGSNLQLLLDKSMLHWSNLGYHTHIFHWFSPNFVPVKRSIFPMTLYPFPPF
jgi:hypothetical protein